jgi:hypothetical protein
MEHTEGIIKDTTKTAPTVHTYEYEQAGNSYLMVVVSIIAGLPLPIINLIATAGYYLAHRRSAYFVRWHCIQAALGQIALIPFNSIALAWTIGIILRAEYDYSGDVNEAVLIDNFSGLSALYWLYLTFVILLNIAEFIVVVVTASQVRKGHNVRWWGIAPIADRLTSKEDRNPYKL